MTDHVSIWSKVESLLKKACEALAIDSSETQQFSEYLDHNELGLAWDELAELGQSDGGRTFWLLMSQAAHEMQLTESQTHVLTQARERLGIREPV